MELRDALIIETYFAIEHHLFPCQLMVNSGELPRIGVAAMAGARLQPHLFVVDEGDGAHAIPLHFEEPVFTARRTLGDGGLHGVDVGGHGRLARALEVG